MRLRLDGLAFVGCNHAPQRFGGPLDLLGADGEPASSSSRVLASLKLTRAAAAVMRVAAGDNVVSSMPRVRSPVPGTAVAAATGASKRCGVGAPPPRRDAGNAIRPALCSVLSCFETTRELGRPARIDKPRAERASTLIASQLPVTDWHAVIGDPNQADAI